MTYINVRVDNLEGIVPLDYNNASIVIAPRATEFDVVATAVVVAF